jgi:WD40 repeat protein
VLRHLHHLAGAAADEATDGELLERFAAALDDKVSLRDVATGKEVLTFAGHKGPVLALAPTPDGKGMISGGSDGMACLWDLATGKELRRFQGHPGGITGAACSPVDQFAAMSGPDGTVHLWHLATGKALRQLQGQAGSP